jgi:hypothetical protein
MLTDEEITQVPESQTLLRQVYARHMIRTTAEGTEKRSPQNPLSLDSFIPLPGYEVQVTSLLHKHDPVQGFGFLDNASLSDDEPEAEDFVLASPAEIMEEKAVETAATKQTRLRRTLDSIGDLSSTSLLGVQYLPLNSCPSGEGMCEVEASTDRCHDTKSARLNNREKMHDLEKNADLPSFLIDQTQGQRDLVTPPTYPEPRKPPPMSR